MITEKIIKGESCTLEYIRDNLPDRLDLQVIGEKGNPLEAFYVEYKGYEYEIDDQYIVTYVGKENYQLKPDLELSLDKIESGVDSVTITAIGSVEEGNIEEIINPDGSHVQGNETNYKVDQNGDYTFIVVTDRGRREEKTITVSNIRLQGLDLTGLITGEDTHNHIYETKYDENNHWQECIICGDKQNLSSHHIVTIGNAATCDVYVNLGQEICQDNCGYAKQIERLPHIRPAVLNWSDWNSRDHIAFQCERCGGGGSNSLQEPHVFNINGKEMTVHEMVEAGIDVHKYESLTCTICKLNVVMNKHSFYSNSCYLCEVVYGPTITSNLPENNNSKIDLVNNDIQYIYIEVDTKGFGLNGITARSLNGGNYTVGIPELIEQQGNIWTYRIPISLIDKSENLTETLELLVDWDTDIASGDILGEYETRTGVRAELINTVSTANTKPEINNIEQIDEESVGDWVIKKKLKITGTALKRELVYVSMYDENGEAIFENEGCQVINGSYEFISDYGVEAMEDTNFTVQVRDIFNNVEEQTITLSHVDSQAPTLISEKEFDSEWTKNKEIELIAEDNGIGQVQIAFNGQEDYKLAEEKDGKYIRVYNLIGDVYNNIQGAIYLKDGLGNIRTEKITIGKIDGTSPTITNVSTRKEGEKTIITIMANDINTELNQNGSGISGYAISRTKEIPREEAFSNNSEITVSNPGTYYIYVKDNVGNFAKREEIVIE